MEIKETKVKQFSVLQACMRVFTTMGHSLWNVFLFELAFKLILFGLYKPLLAKVILGFISKEGYTVITNTNIINFLLGFTGFLLAAILIISSVIMIYFEFAVLFALLYAGYCRKKIKLSQALKAGVCSLITLWHKSTFGFIVYALLLLPLLEVGIRSSLLPKIRIPDFVIGELLKYPGGWIVHNLIKLLPMLIFAKFIFVIPSMVLEGSNFFTAIKRSLQLLKGNTKRVFAVLCIMLGLFYLPYTLLYRVDDTWKVAYAVSGLLIDTMQLVATPFFLTALLVCLMPNANLTAYENIRAYNFNKGEVHCKCFKTLIFLPILIIDFLSLLIRRISRFIWHKVVPSTVRKRPLIVFSLLIIPIYVNNFDYYTYHTPYVVIGHRGSLAGVENTVQAVLGAKEQKAAYAEVDVFLSKDGIPVVIHDSNLLRLAFKNLNVQDLTAEELGKVIMKQNDHASPVQTFDDLCANVHGQIKLLIELKTHGDETESIVDKVNDILVKYGMVQDSIMQTLDEDVLRELKTKHPHYYSGYILFSAMGDISTESLSEIPADFFSIEITMLREELVKTCKDIGREVYVWTVNDMDILKWLLNIQVDGIITDYPKEANQLLVDLELINEN